MTADRRPGVPTSQGGHAGRVTARRRQRATRRWQELRSPLLVAGLVMIAILVFVAAAAPLLAPYDPRAITGASLAHPSARHLLGTNDIGQDIASEVIWGARTSLIVGVAGASLAVAIGIVVGVAAGVAGGILDKIATRIIDLFLAVPVLPLIVLITALLGPSRTVVILVVGMAGWPGIARTLRSQTLTLRERGFIDAARGFGGGPVYLVRRHLAPALGPLIASRWVDWASGAIFLESGLAFLGLGSPTNVSWGSILDRAVRHEGWYFGNLWVWWVLPAGLAITLAVLGFTLVGVGLEQGFNPRWMRGGS